MERLLEGSWVPVAADISGQVLDVRELRVARLSFDAERYAIVDRSGEVVDAGTWQLGALGNPRSMDLLGSQGPNAGRCVLAIIALDGDRLCLGYDMERDQRPSGWRCEPDQLLLSITLVRDSGAATVETELPGE
jgi:uncharacterized protein (TIGR03067 family)